MVNGDSDATSTLQEAVLPDGSLGDDRNNIKVYKDSFSAY